MNKFIKFLIACWILLLPLMIESCGFHLRGAGDFPPALHTLYFQADNVYNGISEELKRDLRAACVNITPSLNEAPLILKLTDSHFTAVMPVAFASTSATSYAYTLTVNVLLMTNNHQVILNNLMTTNLTLTYNVNQTGTPVPPPGIRKALVNQIVSSIYDLLTSISVQQAIENALHPTQKAMP